MRKLDLGDKRIAEKDCFVIAEIGANHMGDPDLCEQMIEEAAKCGVDAVKLQKRNNEAMFTKTGLQRPYDNELSYGKTYGEHREYLDWFGEKEFQRFKMVARKMGILFIVTPFEPDSAEFCQRLGVDAFKIASCDVTNIPLIRQVVGYGKPVIMSTGGASEEDVSRAVQAMSESTGNYAILHCISRYPNSDEDLNLAYIAKLRQTYFGKLIGFSSHHPGILPLMIARTLGASIFEVHFTLNRGWRGTDHGFSMEPRGLETLCQDLKRVRVMLGDGERQVSEEEKQGFVVKMGKAVYPARPLKAGQVVTMEDIVIRSPAEGLRPFEVDEILGRELLTDCSTGQGFKKEWVK